MAWFLDMAETADQIYARVQAGGDLPAPSVTEWDVFPWVVRDGEIAPKPLAHQRHVATQAEMAEP